ncbi:YHS domain-containing (seleno)protein [Oceanicaulis sp. MMSF_3324]|uniref:YHS domain-containing (seleno)protein n=1 Tax=Oceanicaulis sp. MMSF_3324 TaxID=3046702 RepID=UPI00273E66C0|nr:YHS domain-containing (seleno)protein [Oceanicaulis sp. MMSF_3324]
MKTLISTALIGLVLVAFTAPAALAEDENNVSTGYTLAGAPLGLHGSDPVALIETGIRLDGTAEFAAVHEGVAYYFASRANLRTFRRNPEQYIPAYGGFCAVGVALGKKLDGDPRFSAVRDGQLYVFVNEEILRNFLNDEAGTLASAERNWTEIEHTAASDL